MSLHPLFITRSSLSSRSGVGVQTKLFTKAFTHWSHLYWSSAEMQSQAPESVRIENPAFCRWSMLKRPGWHTNFLAHFPLSWWRGNCLRQEKASHLVSRFREQVSILYLAPVDSQDAARMRYLVELFQKPFVLHFWDLLDANLENPDLQWLVRHAGHVFCLSAPLLAEVSRYRSDASYLLFSREPSRFLARPPGAKRLDIGLMGDIASYPDGLALLQETVKLLEERHIQVQLNYIGPVRILKKLHPSLAHKLRPQGFVQSEEMRDKFLSDCHVAFLPGPFKSPDRDMRSRFSIPSRILDFLATGLPVVGAVHPESATADMVRSVSSSNMLFCRNAQAAADAFEQLTATDNWHSSHQDSLGMFSQLTHDCEPQKLKRVMNSLLASRAFSQAS